MICETESLINVMSTRQDPFINYTKVKFWMPIGGLWCVLNYLFPQYPCYEF